MQDANHILMIQGNVIQHAPTPHLHRILAKLQEFTQLRCLRLVQQGSQQLALQTFRCMHLP